MLTLVPSLANADEGGASFWLPGQMASFAAAPGEAGLVNAARVLPHLR